VYVSMRVEERVCVCVYESERERECVYVCVRVEERVCVCVYESERESVCMCL
jgi:hypothetical protein